MQGTPVSELLGLLKPKDRRGSKARCHLLTHGDDATVAGRLSTLAEPWGQVRPDHLWLPRGFETVSRAKLGETPGFLSRELREEVTGWWLAVRPHGDTPGWDIASTCEVGGKPGLLLVEAKAHLEELSSRGKPEAVTPYGQQNHRQIGAAIARANRGFNQALFGWRLSRDTHYRLCSRLAWAWKIASLGTPVLLVYLGFLNATEMADRGAAFVTTGEWEAALRTHAASVVPEAAWDRVLDIGGTPLRVGIRSASLPLPG